MEDIPNEVDAATPVKIEKMVRQFKTHWCAISIMGFVQHHLLR